MFLFPNIPVTARPTYYHHLRSAVFNGVRFGIFSLVFAVAAKSLGVDKANAAMMASAGGLGMMVSIFIAERVRTRPKLPYVIVPSILSNLCLILIWEFHTKWMFVTLVGLSTFFLMLSLPAFSGIQRANYPGSHRATIVGFIRARSFLVTVITSQLAGWALYQDASFYRYLLPAAGVFGLMSTARFMFIRVKGERDLEGLRVQLRKEGRASGLRTTLKDGRFLWFMASFMFFGSGNLMIYPVFPYFLDESLHMNYWQMALAISVLPGVFMVLTVSAWGRLLDRWNPISMRALTTALWSIEPVILIWAAILPAWYNASLAVAIGMVLAARCLRGAIMGGNGLVWNLGVMYFARKEDVPSYFSAHNFLTGVRHVIAPLVGAQIALRWGYPALFVVAGVSMSLGLLIMLAMASYERRAGRLQSFAEQEAEEEAGNQQRAEIEAVGTAPPDEEE